MAAASVAACPSEADCSPFSSSAAGSRGIGVSCRPGCRKPQNRRLRPGLRAAPHRSVALGPGQLGCPSRARTVAWSRERPPRQLRQQPLDKPWPAPLGRRLQQAGRTQALRHRTVLWAGRIERCKRGLRVRGRYAAHRRRPIGFCAGALVRSWVGLAVALLLLFLVLILLLGALGIFRRGEYGIGWLWRRHLAEYRPMSGERARGDALSETGEALPADDIADLEHESPV